MQVVQPNTPSAIFPSGQMEISRLLDLAAERCKVTLEYDPATLRGQVTLRTPSGIPDSELWPLTNRLLAGRGFTTIQLPGHAAFSVVRLQDAAGLARVQSELLDDDNAEAPAPGFQSILIQTQHRPPRELADALTRILSKPGGAAAPIGDGGMLLVSDLTARLPHALEMIRQLDTPGAPVTVEEITLTHRTAASMIPLAMQVAAKRHAAGGAAAATGAAGAATANSQAGELLPGTSGNSILLIAPSTAAASWRELIASLDRPESHETRWYTPRHFPVADVAALIEEVARPGGRHVDERWRLVTDQLTGTIMVHATPAEHLLVANLMERLDQAPEAALRPMRAFTLKNRNVQEVLRIVEQLLRAGLDGAAPPLSEDIFRNSAQRSPGAAGGVGGSSGDISSSQPVTTAGRPPLDRGDSARSPGRLAGAGSAAEADTAILTADDITNTLIAIGDARTLAQIESIIQQLDVRQPQVMLEVLLLSLTESQALDLGVELEQLFTTGGTAIRLSSLFGLSSRAGNSRTVGDGAGFTGVVLSPGDFSIVLRALQNINRGRSLSLPKLLVANNQSAVLNAVLQQPFANINASATVATTSFGGTQDAGTTVTIRPQIAQGDHLILEYSVSLSSFVGNAPAAGLPPPRQQNQIQSLATIPDGYTVVVGGIELESEARAITQIPLLGSIPIIGEAFKSRAHSSNRSRFYIFIRANVLRSVEFEDLKYIADTSLARTEGDIDDGWPTVEPRVIR